MAIAGAERNWFILEWIFSLSINFSLYLFANPALTNSSFNNFPYRIMPSKSLMFFIIINVCQNLPNFSFFSGLDKSGFAFFNSFSTKTVASFPFSVSISGQSIPINLTFDWKLIKKTDIEISEGVCLHRLPFQVLRYMYTVFCSEFLQTPMTDQSIIRWLSSTVVVTISPPRATPITSCSSPTLKP